MATIGATFITALLEFLVGRTPFSDLGVYSFTLVALWTLLWLPLFFTQPIINHASIVSAFVCGGIGFLLNTLDVTVKNNYLNVGGNYIISALLLLQPLIFRIYCKHFAFFSVMNVVYHTFSILSSYSAQDPSRFAYTIPTMACLGLSFYSGRFFETQWKLGFFRRKLVDREAAKLDFLITRDASLLRNIFPKNLSDELQQQIANLRNLRFAVKDQVKSPRERRPSRTTSLTKYNEISRSISNPHAYKPPMAPIISPALSAARLSPESAIPMNKRNFTLSLSVAIPNSDDMDMRLRPSPRGSLLALPPVITTPEHAPTTDAADFDIPSKIHTPHHMVLTSRGTPLRTPNHGPELHTYVNGAQHTDGTSISLSHHYPNVSVIVADVVSFTTLANCMPPSDMLKLLNSIFTRFDDIMDQYQLEKIRTIGDAYLCVANMSIPLQNPEEVAIKVALEMIEEGHKSQPPVNLRVGIASGPLIAGVTGLCKWNYDIFGHPMAAALKMEHLAQPNCIAVTEKVYEPCKDAFNFKPLTKSIDLETHSFYMMEGKSDKEGEISPLPSVNSYEWLDELDMLGPIEEIDPTLTGMSMKEAFEDLTEDINESEDQVDVPLNEFASVNSSHYNAFDPTYKFSYTKEDLEDEERQLRKTRMFFKFTNPEFEADIHAKTVKAVHMYTLKMAIIFCAIPIFCLLVDVDSFDITMRPAVGIIYAVMFGILLLYAIYAGYCDYWRFSGYVAIVPTTTLAVGLLVVTLIDPSEIHISNSVLAILIGSILVRAPPLMVGIAHVLTTIFVAVVVEGYMPHLKHRLGYIVTTFLAGSVAYTAHLKLKKAIRMQFIAQKKVEFDMFHQRLAQHRSHMLLYNIFPHSIIHRIQPSILLTGGRVCVIDQYDQATIMFVNLTNLEALTADLEPTQAFQIYNELFTLFDEATKSFGLEKIKTINTVYMVGAGFPKHTANHVDLAIKLAVEITRLATQYSNPLLNKSFELRIGLATGPVIAGIVGKKKYSYDCWSETVNTASRLEINGWNGHLQMNQEACDLAYCKALFKKRENVILRGKGTMDTYIVSLAKLVSSAAN